MFSPRPLTSVLAITGLTIVSVVVQITLVVPAEASAGLASAAASWDIDAWVEMLGDASCQAGIAACPVHE